MPWRNIEVNSFEANESKGILSFLKSLDNEYIATRALAEHLLDSTLTFDMPGFLI